jgi:chromosome segregation protein
MHLRQIKLAGFKSFVDPTQIDVPGALVGVVGPNGCGKSNVIDAVRWVLGESKAAELRGESMQDVIFNGSANRKPAGRASVELAFDNSDGRLAGEWGRYAEISVKRVLTRDGASSYYINNQTVRRRDVQDMFLGTGLGPRAYAIIGQGMISRIIEARPEDLRVFLEEAAGVSKYKERRRETENRLGDTRDNLTRVEDILRELDGQVGRLEEQAALAQRYQELKSRHDQQQHLLWLARRRDAEQERTRAAAETGAASVAVERATAELRAVERELEEVRAAHGAGGDAVHGAHGELLRVGAEIGRLESEIRLIVDSRSRLAHQIEALGQTRARRQADRDQLEARASRLTESIARLERGVVEAREAAAGHDRRLPQFETAYQAAREHLSGLRAAAAATEQAIEHAGEQGRALERQLAAVVHRRERLQVERRTLGAPDESRLVHLRTETARLQADEVEFARSASEAEANLARTRLERESARAARTEQADGLGRIQARLQAAKEVQHNVEADERLDPWLRAQGLDSLPRLFRRLQVEPGWEAAFEALLRERIEAIEVGHLDTLGGLAAAAPPARLAFYSAAAVAGRSGAVLDGFEPLATKVRGHDAVLPALLGDWLDGVFIAPDLATALAERAQLGPGDEFVTRAGHRVSRHALHFHAADDRKSGLLARRQEIEALERETRAQALFSEQATAASTRAEAAATAAETALAANRRAAEGNRAALHAAQLELVRLEEVAGRVRERSAQIGEEMAEIASAESDLGSQRADAEQRFQDLDGELGARQEAVEEARTAYEAADRTLREAREASRALGAEQQRIEFELGAARTRAEDVGHGMGIAAEDIRRLADEVDQAQLEQARLDDSAARAGLSELLDARARAEETLREARSRHDELGQRLRATDERRLTLEQDLAPMRQRITDSQLREQAARLAVEQFEQQLAEAGADQERLAELLPEAARAPALQSEITRLAGAIAELGPVNLAALQELATATERRSFLDAQSTDLKTAIGTLEDAIRKIDLETRDLLQRTFDQVNLGFGDLFPTLFGGGQAKLVMTGDEILDAGVQVMAQPPGKRNSTIHLLSGGEKALTALALVFAMFRLNPAPFCLLDEVDAPLDDANTERFCRLVRVMAAGTQFLFITHNKIAMELAAQLVGVTMQEQGVSRIVAVDIDGAVQLTAAEGA